MYKYYKTIQNLLGCGLATKEELIKACTNHILKGGKGLPEPTYIKQTTVDYVKLVDMASKDYRFYLEVERQVYKTNIKKGVRGTQNK